MNRQMIFSRKRALTAVAAVAAVGLLVLPGCSASSGGGAASGGEVTEVVVAHSAGVSGEATELLLKKFTEETGIKATGITMSDTDYGAKMQLAAKTAKADFDVSLGVGPTVFLDTSELGVYAKIDTSNWDPADVAAMEEAGLLGEDYVVSGEAAAVLVASNTLETQPTSWEDFFDTEKFPGNRGLASAGLGVPINLEYASIGAGTSPEDLYPLDTDKAFDTIAGLGNNIVLWDNAPKGIQDVVNGDTAMTWAYAAAAVRALEADAPITVSIPEEGTAVSALYAVSLEVGPNGPAAANAFYDWWFKTSTQTELVEAMSYGQVVPSSTVLDQLTPEQQAYLPSEDKNVHVLDYEYYNEKGENGQTNLANVLTVWNEFRAS